MRKALKKSSYLIDKENSIAWVSDVGGGASVGGVVINPKVSGQSREYQDTAERIVKSLKEIKSAAGEHVIQWARLREANSCYPDIIFEMNPNFSVGRSLFCPIVETNPRHQIISGGHKKEGVLFAYNCSELPSSISSLSDISQGIISFVLSQ